MLILLTVLTAALGMDLFFRRMRVKKPVLWVSSASGERPEKRRYLLDGGKCRISRHSDARLRWDPAEQSLHIQESGRDTVLRRGTCLILSDSGEQISVWKHPRRLPLTTLCICVVLAFRFLLVPGIWAWFISPAYNAAERESLDYHWIPEDELSSEERAREDRCYNILLIGTDGRNTLEPRADTMMLVSVNRETRTVSIVSLLRDLGINAFDPYALTLEDFRLSEEDPNYRYYQQMTKEQSAWRFMKLNETFMLHDAQSSEDTYAASCRSLLMNVEQVFGIRIDAFAALDFQAVKSLVDAIGGVDIDIPDQEYLDAMNGVLASQNALFGASDRIERTGVQRLNGNEVLAFCRLRHVGNWSDAERTARQRSCVRQIVKQALCSIPHIDREQLREALGNVTTDLSQEDAYRIYRLLLTGLYTVRSDETLPQKGKWDDFSTVTREGTTLSYVYVPTWFPTLREQVQEVIYPEEVTP